MKRSITNIFRIEKNIPIPNDLFVELDEINVFCSICKLIIQDRSKKRHYKEKHLNITHICHICGEGVKRLTPYLDIHTKRKEMDFNIIHLSNKHDFSNLFSNDKSSFNKTGTSYSTTNEQLLKLYEDDISPFYQDIFVFKSFQIGIGSHGVVNFGLSHKSYESLAVKTYEFNFSKYYSKEINALSKLEKYDFFQKL